MEEVFILRDVDEIVVLITGLVSAKGLSIWTNLHLKFHNKKKFSELHTYKMEKKLQPYTK